MSLLKDSQPQIEGVYNVSKWIKHPALLDEVEMRTLFQELEPFDLYAISGPVNDPLVAQESWLAGYGHYIQQLKMGIIEKPQLTAAMSETPDALYAMKAGEGRVLVRPIRPVIQLQLHHVLPSSADGKFYPGVFSGESFTWGVQFSYPQIYQDPKEGTYKKVNEDFSNTHKFQKMGRWMRQFTVPATFVWKGVKTSVPIRLGKNCFSWINTHPQLISKGITVHVY
jgi:hypothetical protein